MNDEALLERLLHEAEDKVAELEADRDRLIEEREQDEVDLRRAAEILAGSGHIGFVNEALSSIRAVLSRRPT